MIDSDLFAARDIMSKLCEEFPEQIEYQLAYAQNQRHLMMHFMATRRMAEATDAFNKARETLSTLIERSPQQPQFKLELADTLASASVRLKSLDEESADRYLRDAIATSGQLCEAYPTVPEYQALMASSHDKLGMLEWRHHNGTAADHALREATERWFDLLARFPDHRFYQLGALLSATHLAELRFRPELQGEDKMRNWTREDQVREYLKRALDAYQPSDPALDPMARRPDIQANRVLKRLSQQ